VFLNFISGFTFYFNSCNKLIEIRLRFVSVFGKIISARLVVLCRWLDAVVTGITKALTGSAGDLLY